MRADIIRSQIEAVKACHEGTVKCHIHCEHVQEIVNKLLTGVHLMSPQKRDQIISSDRQRKYRMEEEAEFRYNNQIQIRLIQESRLEPIKWISIYSETFRSIVSKGTYSYEDLKSKLYSELGSPETHLEVA